MSIASQFQIFITLTDIKKKKKSQVAHLNVPLLEGLKTLSDNFWLFSLLTYQINSNETTIRKYTKTFLSLAFMTLCVSQLGNMHTEVKIA